MNQLEEGMGYCTECDKLTFNATPDDPKCGYCHSVLVTTNDSESMIPTKTEEIEDSIPCIQVRGHEDRRRTLR